MNAEPFPADPHALASLIDHTLLKPEATQPDVIRICRQAREHAFASVCINPCWVPLVRDQLAASPVRVCTVIGFPLGANDSGTKLAEARLAITQGASELDMVINIGALLSGDYSLVHKEISDLTGIAHSSGAILKVILETCLLTDEQKITASQLACDSQADFVKTSTGFSTGGATEADVVLLRQTVGAQMGVKASGGVRSLDALIRMVRAGANRIGTSSGVQILSEYVVASSAAASPVNRSLGGTSDAY